MTDDTIMFKNHKSSYHIWIFIIGLISTIAYRLVIVFTDYSAFWLEFCWYLGTIGYIWYFGHRWKIENRRDKLIENLNLAHKIEVGEALQKPDQEALTYILKGMSTSWARWNYIAIFIFSFLAIIYAVFSDLHKILK
jgi:hypothetical protein